MANSRTSGPRNGEPFYKHTSGLKPDESCFLLHDRRLYKRIRTMAAVSTEKIFIEKCAEMTANELRDYLDRALEAFADPNDKLFPRRSSTYDALIDLFEEKHTDDLLNSLKDEPPELYGIVINTLEGHKNPPREDLSKRLAGFNRKKLILRVAWYAGFGLGGRNLDQLQPRVEDELIRRIETATDLQEIFPEPAKKVEPVVNSFFLSGIAGLRRSFVDDLQIHRNTYISDADLLSLVKSIYSLEDWRSRNASLILEQLSATGASTTIISIVEDLLNRIEKDNNFRGNVDRVIGEICGPISVLRERKAWLMQEVEDRLVSGSPVRSYLPWTLLPPGENLYETLASHFREVEKTSRAAERQINYSRLKRIESSLCPARVHIGKDGFAGYVAYEFNSTKWVVLECPVYGNATYIFKDNWQTISRLSKWEARYEHSKDVIVIRHNESWFSRLRSTLAASR